MHLPFGEAEFLDVFAEYNRALWPGVVLLWMASVVLSAIWLTGRRRDWRRDCDRWLVGLLAIQWAWAGVAYHIGYFARINPAAYLFGGLFVLQAAAMAWLGWRRRLHFGTPSRLWNALAVGFVAYSLVYPLVTLAAGLRYPRMATFGVPCPTALLTVGLLFSTSPPAPRVALLIPLLWCLIGGSAAFLLGVVADWPLLLGGAFLLLHATRRRAAVQGAVCEARGRAGMS